MSRWFSYLVIIVGLLLPAIGSTVGGQSSRQGQLAIVQPDGNLTLIQADGAGQALTHDAGVNGDTLRFYQWPTWAQSGALAFFATELTRQGDRTLEMWVADGVTTPSFVYEREGGTFTYAYASPAPCAAGKACAPVATLLSGTSPDGFELLLIPTDGTPAQAVGQGAPFYFDWSPDGTQMAWHRGNTRLDIYSVDQNAVVGTLPEQPGQFTAPAFSPAGDGALLFGAWDEASQTTSIVVQRGESRTTIARGLTHPAAFSWSPDGQQVAWSDLVGPLVIADSTTGAELTRTPTTGILAFFWSPAGGRLVYVTTDETPAGSFSAKRVAQQNGPTRLLWNLLTVADGSVQRATSFVPTSEQAYLLGYFDQFGLSHRVWSPDGSRIAYGDSVNPSEPVVRVLDVSGSQPEVISSTPGLIGVWSFQ